MDIIGQNLYINCSIHQKNRVQFIQIKDIQDNKNLFYCQECQNEDDDYKASNYILIDHIQEYNHNQILDKWPPLSDNSLNKKMKQFTQQNNSKAQLSSQIEIFFENLKQQTLKKIDEIKKKMMNNSSQFPDCQREILDQYQNVSKIKNLKQIIIDKSMDCKQKQNEYRKLIQDLTSQQKINSQTFQNIISKHEQSESLIDFKNAENIKCCINKLIDQINIFTLDNHTIHNINHVSKTNECEQKCGLLFDLISTKSNYCSEIFLSSIKSLFNQITPFIQKISFEEVFIKNQKPIDFTKINNQQLDQIRDLCEHFKKMQNESQDQIRNNYKIKQIMEILKSKANYLNGNFLFEFEKYLIESFPLLNKVKFDQIFLSNSKIQVFQQISDETLVKIIEQTQKINQVQKQTLKTNEYCNDLQKSDYEKKELDKLQLKQPIFDYLLKSIDILPQLQILKTNFQQSNQLQITKNQNNSISISLSQDLCTNSVSDLILDQNTSYIFRFQFINNSQDEKFVNIGLLRDSQKDSQGGQNDQMSCHFQINQNSFYFVGNGIDKKEKGDFSLLRNQQEIEMRVCISDGILQILDYPNYNHILSIQDQYKNNLKQQNLRLFIGLYRSNIQIQIIHASKNK